jgi:hypothetical protein
LRKQPIEVGGTIARRIRLSASRAVKLAAPAATHELDAIRDILARGFAHPYAWNQEMPAGVIA